MNTELQAALTKVLEGLLATAQQAGDFGKQQLPLIVGEYLRWGFWQAVILMAILVGAAMLSLHVGKALREYDYAKPTDGYDRMTDGELAGRVVFGMYLCRMAAAVLVKFAIASALTALQIVIAPRVYIIDQLRGML